MKKYDSILQASALFAEISEAERTELLHCLNAQIKQYEKGERMFTAGQAVTQIGLLLSGCIQIFEEDFWGNRNLTAKLGPGELFLESFACTPGAVLTVNIDCDAPAAVLYFNVQKLLDGCASTCAFHNQVLRNLLAVLAQKNLQFHKKLTHISQRSSRGKLLSYLSAESARQQSASFNIPFNRQQLADYLSLNRSAMSQELCRLRDAGKLTFCRNHFELLEQDQKTS